MERQHIESALTELNLNFSSILDQASSLCLGRFLQADLLVMGKFIRIPNQDRWRLYLEVIDPRRADVLLHRQLTFSGDREAPLRWTPKILPIMPITPGISR